MNDINRIIDCDKVLTNIGISTRYNNGEYKPFGNIMSELINVFNKTNDDIMKKYVLTKLFGVKKCNEVYYLIKQINKPKIIYPIEIFDNDDYCVVINENQTALLTSHSTDKENIIDLTILSNEEILNAYNENKQLLYSFIINKNNLQVYDTEIDNLLQKVDRLEEEQDNLYDEVDDMIKELQELNR